MISEKNLTYLYVGNVTNGYADTNSINLDSMPNGSVVIASVAEQKAKLAAISGDTKYQVINKLSDGSIVRSPAFSATSITSKGKYGYSQPSHQVSFLGHDGSSYTSLGTITAGNPYIVALWLNHTRGEYAQEVEKRHLNVVPEGTTRKEVVNGLLKSHLGSYSVVGNKQPAIICERIASPTSVAALTGDATIYKLTHGSKNVLTYIKTAAGTTALTASTASVSAGDVIHIASYGGRKFTFTASLLGSSAGRHVIYIGETSYSVADAGTNAQNATAIVAAINAGTQAIASNANEIVTIVYREETFALPPLVLSSADDNTFTLVAVTTTEGDAVPVAYGVESAVSAQASFNLDTPWQGPTGYLYESTQTTTKSTIGVLTVAGDAWGLKFIGVPQPYNAQVGYPIQVDFDVLTDSFGSAVKEYKAFHPNFGSGNWKQLAELESYTQGNDKSYAPMAYPATQYRREVKNGTGYDVITITAKNEYLTSSTGVNVISPFTITIATNAELSTAYDTIDVALGV